jgi:hypothetical protein
LAGAVILEQRDPRAAGQRRDAVEELITDRGGESGLGADEGEACERIGHGWSGPKEDGRRQEGAAA